MRWNIKNIPNRGAMMETNEFALFPVKIERQWVWLEMYIAVWHYVYEPTGFMHWKLLGRKFKQSK